MGFNPVAEAYLNFGVFGVIVVFALWTIAFYMLSSCKTRAPIGVLLFAVLLPEAIDANRIDFRNVYCIAVYFAATVLIVYLMATLINSLHSRHRFHNAAS